MDSDTTRIFLTQFKITDTDGKEKIFSGPFIFAYDYDEANRESKLLKIEIIGEIDEETKLPILH